MQSPSPSLTPTPNKDTEQWLVDVLIIAQSSHRPEADGRNRTAAGSADVRADRSEGGTSPNQAPRATRKVVASTVSVADEAKPTKSTLSI